MNGPQEGEGGPNGEDAVTKQDRKNLLNDIRFPSLSASCAFLPRAQEFEALPAASSARPEVSNGILLYFMRGRERHCYFMAKMWRLAVTLFL